ncbi:MULTISPECIES: maleate cis-trans isomerase family protein [Streptomyces]|uniref:maleate cis-trans isomerase family protein n=1 Tax=Streptomyces TaxID=1883 RepID=UPI000F76BDAA|nr:MULTISPECIES: aspartate/glutamate racemase family protein [unclassified Streptomyces]MDI3096394.1 aspartate/glutamate racemase family protein [Streptomyces sp. AN-3]RSS89923.1 decarboxylase [Streptomyces sp. WAC02707]
MTALGFLYPGHSGEDDYPRIEQLLGSDIRVDLVHTDIGEDAHREDAHRVDALLEMGSPRRLAAGVEELRLSGADAVVWACTSGSFVHGWEGAQEQVRALARSAGLPASSTSFAFVHAAKEIGARRVAVGATYPDDVARLFADFLGAAGVEVTGVVSSGIVTAAEVGTWTEAEVLALARSADHPDAEAVLLPGTALHTVAHIPALEKELGKPVLTANQVTVWEGLRLADRRVNAPELGALFTREPVVQV